MKVLIVGDGSDAADLAVSRLERAGRTTASCRALDPDSVCRGAEPTGHCPLDDGIDVAVVPLALAEIDQHGLVPGYVCARRAKIPVVAIGDGSTSVDDPGTTMLVHDLHDIAAVVAGVASRPVEPHTTAARRAVRTSLDRHGADEIDASVWVERRDGRLHIHITTGEPITERIGHAAAVRALCAVRDLDPGATVVGVTVA